MLAPPDQPHVERAPRLAWSDLGQALRGVPQDSTCVPINKAVLLLAVPMILEMLMESLFALVNILWVARLGRDAVAIVGLTESVMALIHAVAIGVSVAATAIVARRIGEKNSEHASRAAGQLLILGLAISAGLGALLGTFAPNILDLMGAESGALVLGSDFARIMLSCNATVFMLFVINAIFRGAGDAAIAMRALWLANALNIVLAPCFIFGWGPVPEMGVTGAAVATNLGRGIGVLYQLSNLVGRNSRIHLRARHLRPAPEVLIRILATATTGVVQQLLVATSWLGLFKILATFGSAAVAGYTIAIRIVLFATMPVMGLANAGATLVGQNLGACRPDRAQEAVKIATRASAILLGAVGIAFLVFSRPLVGLFTDDPRVLHLGSQALWIVSIGLPLYAMSICISAGFNGAGDTWTPTWLSFLCFWLGQIPLAWMLAHTFLLGPLGVFLAVLASFSALALWSAVLFRQGRWKLQRV